MYCRQGKSLNAYANSIMKMIRVQIKDFLYEKGMSLSSFIRLFKQHFCDGNVTQCVVYCIRKQMKTA